MFTIHAAQESFGKFYSRVTLAGRTLHGTDSHRTPEAAEQAAREWVAREKGQLVQTMTTKAAR